MSEIQQVRDLANSLAEHIFKWVDERKVNTDPKTLAEGMLLAFHILDEETRLQFHWTKTYFADDPYIVKLSKEGDTLNFYIWKTSTLVAKIWLYPDGHATYRSFVPYVTNELPL